MDGGLPTVEKLLGRNSNEKNLDYRKRGQIQKAERAATEYAIYLHHQQLRKISQMLINQPGLV
jgi:hypothetical protein